MSAHEIAGGVKAKLRETYAGEQPTILIEKQRWNKQKKKQQGLSSQQTRECYGRNNANIAAITMTSYFWASDTSCDIPNNIHTTALMPHSHPTNTVKITPDWRVICKQTYFGVLATDLLIHLNLCLGEVQRNMKEENMKVGESEFLFKKFFGDLPPVKATTCLQRLRFHHKVLWKHWELRRVWFAKHRQGRHQNCQQSPTSSRRRLEPRMCFFIGNTPRRQFIISPFRPSFHLVIGCVRFP